jgi:hypothetical protein
MKTLQNKVASPCCVLNLLRVRDAGDKDGGTGSMMVVAMVLEAGTEPRSAPLSNAGGESLETWLRQRTAMNLVCAVNDESADL